MITFCLVVLFCIALYVLCIGLAQLFGGEGLGGLAVGLTLTPIGLVLIVCDIVAVFKLYGLHISVA